MDLYVYTQASSHVIRMYSLKTKLTHFAETYQASGAPFPAALTRLSVVSQLDLLEAQRKKILSQCAFSIQCCWRRFLRRRRRTRQQSATLIQAGKLLMLWPGRYD